MVIAVDAYDWYHIPWNRNCNACVHFAASPIRDDQNLLSAIWFHMLEDHGIELNGNPALSKQLGKDGNGYRSSGKTGRQR